MTAGCTARVRDMRVVVIRHAKAEPGRPGEGDLERPLAARGEADANAARALLWRMVAAAPWGSPVSVLVSPAVRTRMTYEAIRPSLPDHAHRIEPRLVEASARTLARLIDEEGVQGVATVVLIGHNPGLRDLVDAASDEHIVSLPTSGIAVIKDGLLVSLDVPRA